MSGGAVVLGGEVVDVTDVDGAVEGGCRVVAVAEVEPRSPAVVDVDGCTAKRNETATMANSATTTQGHGPPK